MNKYARLLISCIKVVIITLILMTDALIRNLIRTLLRHSYLHPFPMDAVKDINLRLQRTLLPSSMYKNLCRNISPLGVPIQADHQKLSDFTYEMF